jgi:hypothetical protein
LIIQIPPFSRKWLILLGKVIGRLFYIFIAALKTNTLLTSWFNEMILTENIEKELIEQK